MSNEAFQLQQIGVIRSELKNPDEAPMQGNEGAPDAWLEVDARYAEALRGLAVAEDVILITWFHLSDRDALQVHPRSDPSRPLSGVFATRSPERPNP
jgi:tRNA-Thr(GGU) m(6)t(6)A37 methyltransferase TsaA